MDRRAFLGRAPAPVLPHATASADLTPFAGAWTTQRAANLVRRTHFGAARADVVSAFVSGQTGGSSAAVDAIVDTADNRLMGSATFISAGDFGDGLAPVRTDNLWEYVDEAGGRSIEPRFSEARAFVKGRAAVQVDGLWTFVRTDGSLLRDPEFDEVGDFDGDLAAVWLGEKLGYIDRDGATVWLPRD